MIYSKCFSKTRSVHYNKHQQWSLKVFQRQGKNLNLSARLIVGIYYIFEYWYIFCLFRVWLVRRWVPGSKWETERTELNIQHTDALSYRWRQTRTTSWTQSSGSWANSRTSSPGRLWRKQRLAPTGIYQQLKAVMNFYCNCDEFIMTPLLYISFNSDMIFISWRSYVKYS